MNEFALIQKSIGLVMCLVFPAIVGVMIVAYLIVLWRERRDRDEPPS